MHVEKEAILFFRETTNDLGRESKKTAVCGDERLVMTQTLYRFSPRVGLMKEKEEISRLLYNLSVCWGGIGSAIIFAHSVHFMHVKCKLYYLMVFSKKLVYREFEIGDVQLYHYSNLPLSLKKWPNNSSLFCLKLYCLHLTLNPVKFDFKNLQTPLKPKKNENCCIYNIFTIKFKW